MDYIFENERDIGTDEYTRPVGVCACCGKGIFQPDEAMVIKSNRDMIHLGCWEDYASENYDEFLCGLYE